jgi:multidrug efflux pump
MNISAPFIRRPVGTTLLTIAVALAGVVAYLQLPVAPLPQVDFPTISVQASLPGASPEIMAASVAAPLERQLGHIAGVSEMTSASYLSSTSITLQFDLNRNIDGAARDVQAAINAARANLPANLPSNPTYRKVNPADAPIMILALTSDTYDRGKMYDAASTIIQQRLLQIQGVGQVNVGGGALPAVRVDVNPTQLNSFGLGLEDVRQMLSRQNANLSKGQLSDNNTTADILANDQLLKASDYKPLILNYTNGAAIRLSDIANVQDSVENIRAAGFLNGKPSIPLIILRQPGANIIETVDRIKAALPGLKASVPAAIKMSVVLDRTTTIRASVREIERTLLIAIALVIFIVFVFLRSPRSTLIPAIVVPVSLIATCGVMYLCGYSVDNLSLMALTISTGFVVDDAIVVIENISRHLELGMSPMEAALKGAQEVGFTVLSISVSLVAVFLPILLMGGIVGRLFREFAVVLSTAIFVSLLISLTTTPMMCARLLRHQNPDAHGRLYQASEKVFDWLLKAYERTLRIVLRHPVVTLIVLLITVSVNVLLFVIVPKGFFPQQDNGTIFGGLQGPQDTSFPSMQAAAARIVNIVKEDPAVNNTIVFTGGNGAANGGFVYMALKPLAERKINAGQVINRLRPKLAAVRGASVFVQAGQDLRIGGRQSSAQYQYTIQSDSLDDLVKWGPLLLQQMRKLRGFTDVNSDQQNHGLQVSLVYDRSTAARLGISPAVIDNTLYDAFGQRQVSTMYTSLNQYHVVMEVAPQFWQSPEGLNSVYVRSTNGGRVIPLSAIAHYEPTTAPIAVNHQGQFPSVTLSFNLSPGVALSDAVKTIHAMEQSIGMPGRIHGSFSGTMQAFQTSLKSEPFLILAALAAVYIVLGILYESYLHPITILSTLPSAGVGAVLALMLFRTDLSVMALIGILLLIGIVKKNAIMMIDFALSAEREGGDPPSEVILQACLLRFRPIMMTTLAAMFGALPLVISTSVGSELRRPLGITIVGGLIMSQILTLYTTPVVYLALDRLRLRWEAWRKGKATPAPFGTLGSVANVLLVGIAIVAICGSTGCNLAPQYKRPAVQTPAAYKEVQTSGPEATNIWKTAQPNDAAARGKWWELFGNSQLNALEEQIVISNQNVAAAYANFLSARAIVKESQAQLYPTLAVNPSVTKARQPPSLGRQSVTTYSIPLDATWEPDLWGRVRNTVKANAFEAQATAADLENTRLSVQAELAADFFQLRAQDALKGLFDDTVRAYKESLDLTRVRFQTGIASDEDVAQAETQLETAEAQATNLGILRARLEHAMAVLIGKPPAELSIPVEALAPVPPPAPAGVPSGLLERRPDIAAAERRVAEANARIGIVKAAYYPNLTLSASAGLESISSSGLFNWSSRVWSASAGLAETIFDAGQRKAAVEQSRADYDNTVAKYRQTVLTAFQQVEDNLAALRILASEVDQQETAVRSSERYLNLANDRYKLGIDSYLNVIIAQATYLSNRQTLVNLRTQQITASVQLVQALGGGWDASQLPSS